MIDLGHGIHLIVAAASCYSTSPTTQPMPSWVPDWRKLVPGIKAHEYNHFDLKIVSGICVEFLVQIYSTFSADMVERQQNAGARGAVVKNSNRLSLLQPGDVMCRFATKDGNLSLNTIALRKIKQTDKFHLVGGGCEWMYHDKACNGEGRGLRILLE